MSDVKLADSGTRKKEHLKTKIDELETNSKFKNMRDLCRCVIDFNMDFQPRINIVQDEKGNLVTDTTLFWLGGGNISFSCSLHMWLVMLGRQKYKQQNL
jgi:hypothetical protein